MASKVKCPSCGAELELPDDPRVSELVQANTELRTTLTRINERLEKQGKEPVPAPPATPVTPTKGKRKRYEGIMFDDDEEVED